MTAESGRELVRHRVVYAGRVQGVFFRATTADLSRRCAVVGFVRNLPDGRVELEAQGPAGEVEDFLSKVQSHFARHIRSVQRTTLAARADETAFEIRY